MSTDLLEPAAPTPADAQRSAIDRITSWFKRRAATVADDDLAGGVVRAWLRELEACAREQGGPVASRARAGGLIDL